MLQESILFMFMDFGFHNSKCRDHLAKLRTVNISIKMTLFVLGKREIELDGKKFDYEGELLV